MSGNIYFSWIKNKSESTAIINEYDSESIINEYDVESINKYERQMNIISKTNSVIKALENEFNFDILY